MRIIQIIDSLEAGGAERMAVNYANALVNKMEFSGLITTRKEGVFLKQVDKSVSYLYLKKQQQLDFDALFKLRNFVKKNKVTHVHAHSTSFFLAFLLKLTYPSLKIIWHNHYGNSEILSKKRLFILRIVIPFFSGIIAVNQKLKVWAEQKLKSKNVIYLPNFTSKGIGSTMSTALKGTDGKRILSLANLREDKNHFLLLEVAQKLKQSYPDWTFHLVGKDFEDEYSKQIKKIIKEYDLGKSVFLYGSSQDVSSILHQAAIAILTSRSEGLPVALLEYGLYKKPVIVTDVGEIPFVIQNRINGIIVPSQNELQFYDAIVECIENNEFSKALGNHLSETISNKFSEKAIITQYLNWLETI